MLILLSLLLGSHSLVAKTCFGGSLNNGAEHSHLKNIVSAAAFGAAMSASMQSAATVVTSSMFPIGFAWLIAPPGSSIPGFLFEQTTSQYFNGSRLGLTYAGAPYFTYSPKSADNCGAGNYNYSGAVIEAQSFGFSGECMNSVTFFINHLVDFIGATQNCPGFVYNVSSYSMPSKFSNPTDAYGVCVSI